MNKCNLERWLSSFYWNLLTESPTWTVGFAFVQFASPSTTMVLECEGLKRKRMMETRNKWVEEEKVPMGIGIVMGFLLLGFLFLSSFYGRERKEDTEFLLFRFFFWIVRALEEHNFFDSIKRVNWRLFSDQWLDHCNSYVNGWGTCSRTMVHLNLGKNLSEWTPLHSCGDYLGHDFFFFCSVGIDWKATLWIKVIKKISFIILFKPLI